MIKKIFGGLFFATAALVLIGSVLNGSFMSDKGSVAETYGSFIGTMLPIILYILAGIFLMTFDNAYKKNFIEGFKVRKKQCTKIVAFIAMFTVFMLFSVISAGFGAVSSGNGNSFLKNIISALPFFVPMIFFSFMLSIYAIPYWACKKNFISNDAQLNEYLSTYEIFYSYSEDNSVVAIRKTLFFPRTFCLVPFNQISSMKYVDIGIEKDIYFNLTNGKKIEMVCGKKKYDNIVAAVNANKR